MFARGGVPEGTDDLQFFEHLAILQILGEERARA
jgi:hypothetical protein